MGPRYIASPDSSPAITNRCHAELPTRTTYGTTRPYQTLHRSHKLTNGVSLHNTSLDTTNGIGSPHNSGEPLTTCACTKESHTCPLTTLPVELLALTANGLTCICSRTPWVQLPSLTPLFIVHCKFKEPMEPLALTASAQHTGTSPHSPPAHYLSFTACT